jgi:hypothetical protein
LRQSKGKSQSEQNQTLRPAEKPGVFFCAAPPARCFVTLSALPE